MSSLEVVDLFRRLRGKKTVFIGTGNPYRGDDGAGLLLVELLAEKIKAEEFHYLLVEENPENFAAEIVGLRPEAVVLVDAARFGGRAGEIRLIEEGELNSFRISTHTYSPGIFLAYLRKALGCRVYLVGIQGEDFEIDLERKRGVSRRVEEGLHELVEVLGREWEEEGGGAAETRTPPRETRTGE